MTESKCHKAELRKAGLFNGREKVGDAYYCPECLKVVYYSGEFHWEGWEIRTGTQGWGAYYRGKGVKKPKNLAPNHGLDRKEMMAADGYQKQYD